jgi:hypothetical protein
VELCPISRDIARRRHTSVTRFQLLQDPLNRLPVPERNHGPEKISNVCILLELVHSRLKIRDRNPLFKKHPFNCREFSKKWLNFLVNRRRKVNEAAKTRPAMFPCELGRLRHPRSCATDRFFKVSGPHRKLTDD